MCRTPRAPGPGEVLRAPGGGRASAAPTSTISSATSGTFEDAVGPVPAGPGSRGRGDLEEIGPDCPSRLAAGDARRHLAGRVAAGSCYPCSIGRDNACARIDLMGIHRDGALQEQLVLPARAGVSGRGAEPGPDRADRARLDRHADRRSRPGCSRESASSSSEPARSDRRWRSPLSTAAPRCCSSTGSRAGSRSDRRSGPKLWPRRPTATSWPRHETWAGADGPEVVVEATGVPGLVRSAVALVASAGRVLVVGLSSDDAPLRVGDLAFKELDVLGVELLRSERVRPGSRSRRRGEATSRGADHPRVHARTGARGDRAMRSRIRPR